MSVVQYFMVIMCLEDCKLLSLQVFITHLCGEFIGLLTLPSISWTTHHRVTNGLTLAMLFPSKVWSLQDSFRVVIFGTSHAFNLENSHTSARLMLREVLTMKMEMQRKFQSTVISCWRAQSNAFATNLQMIKLLMFLKYFFLWFFE